MFAYDEVPYELGPQYNPSETIGYSFGDAMPPDPMVSEAYGSVLGNAIGWEPGSIVQSTQKMVMTMTMLIVAALLIGILGIGALVVLSKK